MDALAVRRFYASLQLPLVRFSWRLLSRSISIPFARSMGARHYHRASGLRVLPIATLRVSLHGNVSITRAFGNAWMCLPDPPPKMSLMAAQRRTVSSACGRAPVRIARICCAVV
jgi:hypothetical protein